ncbi:MAG: hypothetical protein WB347_05095 [Terriglobales bacterium]|jgi:hypothetical protein
MLYSKQLLGIVLAAILASMTAARGADPLTQADWQYLESINYSHDSYAIKRMGDSERIKLHALILDPKLSGEAKQKAVYDFVLSSGLTTPPRN